MKEIDRFVRLQKQELSRRESRRKKPGAPAAEKASRRVGVALRQLLVLGIELRAELPDPEGFLQAAASAGTEAALLVAPEGSSPEQAIDHLAGLQKDRLIPQIHPGTPSWRRFPAEVYLMRAFWQLSGIGLEVMLGGWRDGQLEEHAADLANYLVFVTSTSGAWELCARERVPDPWTPAASVKVRACE